MQRQSTTLAAEFGSAFVDALQDPICAANIGYFATRWNDSRTEPTAAQVVALRQAVQSVLGSVQRNLAARGTSAATWGAGFQGQGTTATSAEVVPIAEFDAEFLQEMLAAMVDGFSELGTTSALDQISKYLEGAVCWGEGGSGGGSGSSVTVVDESGTTSYETLEELIAALEAAGQQEEADQLRELLELEVDPGHAKLAEVIEKVIGTILVLAGAGLLIPLGLLGVAIETLIGAVEILGFMVNLGTIVAGIVVFILVVAVIALVVFIITQWGDDIADWIAGAISDAVDWFKKLFSGLGKGSKKKAKKKDKGGNGSGIITMDRWPDRGPYLESEVFLNSEQYLDYAMQLMDWLVRSAALCVIVDIRRVQQAAILMNVETPSVSPPSGNGVVVATQQTVGQATIGAQGIAVVSQSINPRAQSAAGKNVQITQ